MTVSIVIALIIHIAVFIVFQFEMRLWAREEPDYGGPIIVTINEHEPVPKETARQSDQDTAVSQQGDEGAEEPESEQAAAEPRQKAEQPQPEPEPEPAAEPAPDPEPAPEKQTVTAEKSDKPSEAAPKAEPKEQPSEGAKPKSGSPSGREEVEYYEIGPREIDEQTTFNAPVQEPSDQGEVVEDFEYKPTWDEPDEQNRQSGGFPPRGTSDGDPEGAGSSAGDSQDSGSSIDVARLDEALGRDSATSSSGSSSGSTAPDSTGPSSTSTSDRAAPGTPDITWEEGAEGRSLRPGAELRPKEIPRVQQEGRSIVEVKVHFEVTPQGLTKPLEVETSSGYSDVNAAVLEVVRKLTFNPIKDDKVVRGWYYIRIETR